MVRFIFKSITIGVGVLFSVGVFAETIPIDLKKCTIGKNKIPFAAFIAPKTDNEKDAQAHIKKIAMVIEEEIGIKARPDKWGDYYAFDSAGIKTSLSIGGQGATYGSIIKFSPSKLTSIYPKFKDYSSAAHLQAIFKDELIRKRLINNGAVTRIHLLLCGRYKAEISVLNLPLKSENKRYEGEYKASVIVDLYGAKSIEHMQAKSVNQKKQKGFNIGDSVYVIFKSGKKCPGSILIPGDKQSKVEYIKWCETGFISSKSKGAEEWVPNSAIGVR